MTLLRFAACLSMCLVHFLASSLDDIYDAYSNIKKVFSSSASENKSEDNSKLLNKTFSKSKQVAKAIKTTGTAGCDVLLDGGLILAGSCGDFRRMIAGKFVSFLDCDPESYGLFS